MIDSMGTGGLPESQRNVQRLLGRCMILIQYYERLIEALLAHHRLDGPEDRLQEIRDQRTSSFESNTLGTLVRALCESYLVPRGAALSAFDQDSALERRPAAGFAFGIEMNEEDLVNTKSSLRELVTIRNELVHHLIDKYDLGSVEECFAAEQYLENCFARIDGHVRQLVDWTGETNRAKSEMAAFLRSDQFQTLLDDAPLVHRFGPIVVILKDAAGALIVNGWTPLQEALAWISTRYPAETPAKYSCKSWPQVLHESKAFDLQYRGDDGGRKSAWYRERQPARPVV